MTPGEKLAWQVRSWWNERIAAGCQLKFVDDTVPRIDWVGENTWKRRVSMDALWLDFCRSRGVTCKKAVFAEAFNRATGNRDRVLKKVPNRTPRGLQGEKLVAFVRFGDRPERRLLE